jgi:iron complex outermembrane recepter protein
MGLGKSSADTWLARSIVVLTAALLLPAGAATAQPDRVPLTGTVIDPSGLGIPGVEVTVVDSITGASRSAVSDRAGRYRLPDLSAGKYRLTVEHPGFAPYSREIILDKVPADPLDIGLRLLRFEESVTVRSSRVGSSDSAFRRELPVPADSFAADTAQLLDALPGVSLYGNGGVSSLPAIHGLADDRVRIKVDGMDLISACANHMNPPLSYIDPSNVGAINLFAGIAPVSVGGDSIGGTISVDSPRPEFATTGQHLLLKGRATTSYRGKGDGYGTSLQFVVGGESLTMTYNGSFSRAENYRASQDFKPAGNSAAGRGSLDGNEVGSSRYESQNHALGFALRRNGHLVDLRLGLQNIPYQGFPTQRMDMTRNDGVHANLRYAGQYGWGALDARAYADYTRHSMDFADDKQYYYGSASTFLAPGMPMETKGVNLGALVRADIPLSGRDTLSVGAETQRYRLDDWWPPSPSVLPPGYTVGGMAPNTFINISDGRRDRIAVYGEWERRWRRQWSSLLGIRSDNVLMDTGAVRGYNDTAMYDGPPVYPATTFNGRDRKRTDHNIDATALSRYTPSAVLELEAGYAMKSRSPNLYERYAWSTNTMAMEMINFAGDGNYYLGNLDLKPETAHTFSATVSWHAVAKTDRGISVTPYYTSIEDYVDARRCPAVTVCGSSAAVRASETATTGFVYLQFVNQRAELSGIDVSGHSLLARLDRYGSFTATGTLSVVRGKNRTTGGNLYNVMPVNTRLAVVHNVGRWTNVLEAQVVGSKTHLSAVRNEFRTEGYGLLNLRSSFGWTGVRIDVGVENLLDTFYTPPLGGAYLGQGPTMSGAAIPWGIPVAGAGRALYASVSLTFESR